MHTIQIRTLTEADARPVVDRIAKAEAGQHLLGVSHHKDEHGVFVTTLDFAGAKEPANA